jgi:hypothetical protein
VFHWTIILNEGMRSEVFDLQSLFKSLLAVQWDPCVPCSFSLKQLGSLRDWLVWCANIKRLLYFRCVISQRSLNSCVRSDIPSFFNFCKSPLIKHLLIPARIFSLNMKLLLPRSIRSWYLLSFRRLYLWEIQCAHIVILSELRWLKLKLFAS